MFRPWMFLLEHCKLLFHVLVVCAWSTLNFLGCSFCFLSNRLSLLDSGCHASPKLLNLLQEPDGIVNRGQTRTPQLSAAVDWIAIAMKSFCESVTIDALTRTVRLTACDAAIVDTMSEQYNASLTTNRPSSAPLP